MNIVVPADTIDAKALADRAKATVNPPQIGVKIETAKVSTDATAGVTVAFDPPVRTEYTGGEPYDGEYVVIPKANEAQTLLTRNKVLSDNVTVTKVPYYETSNIYGDTVYIASEVS